MNVFSVSSDGQDVEVLLGDVAEAIRQWEEGAPLLLDLSITLGETSKVSERASRLKEQWNVDSSAIIHSTRPALGPWIIRFQNLVRKFTWWYLEPIVHQIRAFQMSTALTANGLAQNQEKLLDRHQDLVAELAALQERVEALEAQTSTRGGSTNADAGS